MSPLLWILVVLVAIGVIFRLFGRQIFRWFLRFLAKQAVRHMQKQNEAYDQQYSNSPFEQRVRTGEGQELHIPRKQDKPKPRRSASSAEDVDYEEL
jgi:hypothetical protein